MFIAILTLLSALSISGVAIFYSVIGLATIFPGAFWPVVIMGSVLEVGKLVTASWLYRNWKQTRFLLKTYLTIAVVVLSLITSMGIFGFLSKAHLEQNLAEDTVTQRIDNINNMISSEKDYIERQKNIITRAENTFNRTSTSNKDEIEIEKQSLKDAEEKFKTLLAVETNTLKDLNDRLKVLDKDVSDVLTSNKSFFNEEKAAQELKASQKDERLRIEKDIQDAKGRIEILKSDYNKDIAVIQSRIDKLRNEGGETKIGVNTVLEDAETKIQNAQNRISDLIVERQPLESQMIKLEAEVGPVKYIAALVVDWGVTTEVDTSEAVRWVILIIIFVFDPLAVLLLVAANQSLIRRFPVREDPPQEIIDLEKPDPEPPMHDPQVKQWNEMIDRMNKEAARERDSEMKNKVNDWQNKLTAFHTKVMEEDKKLEEQIPHIDLKGQKKTEKKEIVVDNMKDGFDPAEVMFDMDPVINPEWKETLPEELQEQSESTIAQDIEEAMEPERIKPDLTEVIEPEQSQPKVHNLGSFGTVKVDKRGKAIEETLPKPTKEEAEIMLKQFHNQHGKFKDISEDDLKKERDTTNKVKFLEDVPITKEDAENHPPMTKSRMAFFQDHIDDVLRGNTTAENLPPDVAKTVAILLSDYDNPTLLDPMPNTAVEQTGLNTMPSSQLKEEFMIDPETEDRDITDEELDKLIEGTLPEQQELEEFDIVIKNGQKIKVPKQKYEQNEEQKISNQWSKILPIEEPEKNEVVLPELSQDTEIVDNTEKVDLEVARTLPNASVKKHKNRMISDEEYRMAVDQRINSLIEDIDNGKIKFEDLTEQDQNSIIDVMRENV
jgi:hypothetical protein|tara:strand:+ start:114 stop:2612 length:2499 start_codon:yes stop_codon:yes gene_type:complete